MIAGRGGHGVLTSPSGRFLQTARGDLPREPSHKQITTPRVQLQPYQV